ncbi:hypothetical protein FHT86_001823 [Rhizobium sp. BK313]|nr:hypothetical protein [Rhizobium sp. BK313]
MERVGVMDGYLEPSASLQEPNKPPLRILMGSGEGSRGNSTAISIGLIALNFDPK